MYMQHRHFWWDYVVRVRDGEERRGEGVVEGQANR